VLECLGATSDAERPETTTTEKVASTLDADRQSVEAHLDGLTTCELARTYPDGRVRVTVTGEQLLELGADATVIVEA